MSTRLNEFENATVGMSVGTYVCDEYSDFYDICFRINFVSLQASDLR